MEEHAAANLTALMESTEDLIWSVDLEFRLLTFNRALRRGCEIGYGTHAAVGQRLEQELPPETAAQWPALYRRALAEGPIRIEQTLFGNRVFELTLSPIMADGQATGVSVLGRDITERKATEQQLAHALHALKSSENRYRTAFQTSLDGMIISDLKGGKIVEVNDAFLNLMQFEREEVLGRTAADLNIWMYPQAREQLADVLRRDSSLRDTKTQLRKKNGEVFWSLASASLIEIDCVTCVLCVMRDISDARAAEDKISNLAFYDPLTSLPNRRLLLDRLRQALAASTRSGSKRALMILDLDNFKTLNATLGQQAGDLMLQEVARRLSGCVRETDTVARLGGDEFAVILEELSEVPEEAAAQAGLVGEKILSVVDQPYWLDGRECLSTSCIGITVFGDQIKSTNEILQQADIAMYQAREAGSNTLRFFAPALQTAVNARSMMEADLRLAIRTNQFELYYQPQVDASGLIGAEALIRWKHPVRGLRAPGEFIPLAEETGLILPLGDWVLEAACKQIAAWAKRAEAAHLTVAVNISARQFRQPGFVDRVMEVVQASGANPKNLKLELTESMLVEDIEDVIAKMTEFKSHGIGFSLDDFGTGYSSLAYLKRLPLDQLKIDRSFVRDILEDAGSRAIAQSVVSLGEAFGLTVIAEGVETGEQRDYLDDLGCHSFQGYFFGRPLPFEDFQRLVPGFAAADVSQMN
jgi:diguanylate cyclase (GGDEF)-like protein/PAS domain S-box-containing protein